MNALYIPLPDTHARLDYGVTACKGPRRVYFGPYDAADASAMADELRADGWTADVMFGERTGT